MLYKSKFAPSWEHIPHLSEDNHFLVFINEFHLCWYYQHPRLSYTYIIQKTWFRDHQVHLSVSINLFFTRNEIWSIIYTFNSVQVKHFTNLYIKPNTESGLLINLYINLENSCFHQSEAPYYRVDSSRSTRHPRARRCGRNVLLVEPCYHKI